MSLQLNENDLKWIESQLKDVVETNLAAKVAKHIASVKSFSEKKEYLENVLNKNNPFQMKFVEDFKRKFSYQIAVESSGATVHKKSQDAEDYFSGLSKTKVQAKVSPFACKEPKSFNQCKPKIKESSQLKSVDQSVENYDNSIMNAVAIDSSYKELPNRKTKFVNLYSEEAKHKDIILLKGRHACRCQATKHDLINNCLICGKIVCSQEGSGPCLFCGALVCTAKELDIINRGSKQSNEMISALMMKNDDVISSLSDSRSDKMKEKAEVQKNKLLEFDRNSASRTKVIDDEADYFSIDALKWMTNDQRLICSKKEKEYRERRYGSRLNLKIDFDFAGRRIAETTKDCSLFQLLENDTVHIDKNEKESVEKHCLDEDISREADFLQHPSTYFKPMIDASLPLTRPLADSRRSSIEVNVHQKKASVRLQDPELQEMSDQGVCLSVQQPYASLLVNGIKTHEGRNWYTAHRGRLWIHASAKQPSEDEVKHIKEFYNNLFKREIKFPSHLPTGCIIGYVDVKDVLPQEQYATIHQPRQSQSPFVFICENHQEIGLKLPMAGKQGIFKLDQNIHRTVKLAHLNTNEDA